MGQNFIFGKQSYTERVNKLFFEDGKIADHQISLLRKPLTFGASGPTWLRHA